MTAAHVLGLWDAAKYTAEHRGGNPIEFFRQMIVCPNGCDVCSPAPQQRLFT